MSTVLFYSDQTIGNQAIIKTLTQAECRVLAVFQIKRFMELQKTERSGVWIFYCSSPNQSVLDLFTQFPQHPPVICIVKQSEAEFRLAAWKAGVADFWEWPMPPMEATVRLKRLLSDKTELQLGEYVYEFEQGKLTRETDSVWLSKLENALLQGLAKRQNTFVSRQMLLDTVWPVSILASDDALDVLIRRLRLKVRRCGFEIISRRGFGYQLVSNGIASSEIT